MGTTKLRLRCLRETLMVLKILEGLENRILLVMN
jgi:hypothetical protein